MKISLLFFLTLVLTIMLTVVVYGQPGFPGGPTGPTQAPIDGGLGLLAAAGGAYAWKKLKDKNQESDPLA